MGLFGRHERTTWLSGTARTALAVGCLLVLLTVLAVLQYRWIDSVSVAERRRQYEVLQLAVTGFAEEINAEISRPAIELAVAQTPGSDAPNPGENYRRWLRLAPYPRIVKRFLTAEMNEGRLSVEQYDPQSGKLNNAAVPDYLELRLTQPQAFMIAQLPEFAARVPTDVVGYTAGFRVSNPAVAPGLSVDPLVAIVPFASFFSARIERIENLRQTIERPVPVSIPPRWAVVEFDESYVVSELIPALVKKHFPGLDSDYRIMITKKSDPGRILYSSDSAVTTARDLDGADAEADLLRFGPPVPRPLFDKATTARVVLSGMVRAEAEAFWMLRVKHRQGSLDAAATTLRRRNLGISFGILSVLGASVVLLIRSGARTRELASRQVAFAAGVSHELRTPLAVIHTAAYGLTSGIIRTPHLVDRNARIILEAADELAGMVELVFLFAESRSGFKRFHPETIEINETVERALASLSAPIERRNARISIDVPDGLPAVHGNAAGLAHCIQNGVQNAIKYGADSDGACFISIIARRQENAVKLCICDSGTGIRREDEPHLFEAFYRGRDVPPGTRGAGLGLYIVARMMEAQNGTASIANRPEGGCCLVLTLRVSGEAKA